MKHIAVLGPNPARQKTLFFNKFNCGSVNRAYRMTELAAGKGINFCRALKCDGQASGTLIQFCGGPNGDFVNRSMKEEGMTFISIPSKGATRCCTTCLDEENSTMTEIIEPSHAASEEEIKAMLENYRELLKSSSGTAFCGSLPDGTDPSLYVRAAGLAAERGIPLLIDAFRDMDEVFAAGAAIILKINREELVKLSGESDVIAGLKAVFSRYPGLIGGAITDGPGRAFASDGRAFVSYELPPLTHVASPLGCGDTASAVMMANLVSGKDMFSAFAAALAGASANCLNPDPGSFCNKDAAELMPAMKEL